MQHFSPTIAPPTMRVSSPLPVPPAGLQENSSIAAVPSAAATCTATGSASGTAGAAIEHTAAAGTAVVAGAVAGVAEEETREEVVQLMRSRATQLVHYSILLLHTVLAQLARQAGISSSGDGGSDSDKQDIHRAVIEVHPAIEHYQYFGDGKFYPMQLCHIWFYKF